VTDHVDLAYVTIVVLWYSSPADLHLLLLLLLLHQSLQSRVIPA